MKVNIYNTELEIVKDYLLWEEYHFRSKHMRDSEDCLERSEKRVQEIHHLGKDDDVDKLIDEHLPQDPNITRCCDEAEMMAYYYRELLLKKYNKGL